MILHLDYWEDSWERGVLLSPPDIKSAHIEAKKMSLYIHIRGSFLGSFPPVLLNFDILVQVLDRFGPRACCIMGSIFFGTKTALQLILLHSHSLLYLCSRLCWTWKFSSGCLCPMPRDRPGRQPPREIIFFITLKNKVCHLWWQPPNLTTFVPAFVCAFTCACVCMCVCARARASVYVGFVVCMCVCACVCASVCTCVRAESDAASGWNKHVDHCVLSCAYIFEIANNLILRARICEWQSPVFMRGHVHERFIPLECGSHNLWMQGWDVRSWRYRPRKMTTSLLVLCS